MIWDYGFSWGGMFLMMLSMALWIALLVVLVWALIRWIDRRNTVPSTQQSGISVSGPSAMEILRQRYARGEIDIRRTLRDKLGAEMEPYLILGACNPVLAHRALEQEPEIGLLLPCNVVVRAVEDGSRVEIADPEAMLGIVGKEQLDIIAKEAKQRLLRVIAALESLG